MNVANWSFGKIGTSSPFSPIGSWNCSMYPPAHVSSMRPMPPTATMRLPTHGVLYRDVFANTAGTRPSRPRAKNPRPMTTQIASASAIASRITTSSSRVAYQLPTYFVAISLTGPGEKAQAPSETAALP